MDSCLQFVDSHTLEPPAGLNRQLGLGDELFVLGDSVILTVLGQVSFLPLLVLAARSCPEVRPPPPPSSSPPPTSGRGWTPTPAPPCPPAGLASRPNLPAKLWQGFTAACPVAVRPAELLLRHE